MNTNVDAITEEQRQALGLPPKITRIPIPGMRGYVEVTWQTGPIETVGAQPMQNGVTLEQMIEACIERLEGFNSTKFRCRENSLAITALEEARNWLLQRTRARQARGVEGTLEA